MGERSPGYPTTRTDKRPGSFASMNLDSAELPISEVVRRTGIPETTLRVWESRYGFPRPRRLPGGHRRYSDDDCHLLHEVKALRAAGMPFADAVQESRRRAHAADSGIVTGLVRRHPQLEQLVLPRSVMLALSQAIEDHAATTPGGGIVIGAFQSGNAWRRAERRWRRLVRDGRVVIAFADFDRPHHVDGIWRIPVGDSPLAAEWAVIADTGRGACLAGRELQDSDGRQASPPFEARWSMAKSVTRSAARLAVTIAACHAPEVAVAAAPRLRMRVLDADRTDDHTTSLTNRLITNLLRAANRG